MKNLESTKNQKFSTYFGESQSNASRPPPNCVVITIYRYHDISAAAKEFYFSRVFP